MITFKQFLSEEDGLTTEKGLPSFIKSDITQLLGEINVNDPLLRGIKRDLIVDGTPVAVIDTGLPTEVENVNYTIKVFKFNMPYNRKPVSMSNKQSELADDWFERNFGLRFRAQSMFCVRAGSNLNESISFTTSYGIPCVVAPIGSFTYAWSPEYDDLFFSLNYGSDTEMEKRLEADLEAGDYQINTGLDKVPEGHEIMIQGSSYYAFALFEHSTPVTYMTREQQEVFAKVLWS